MYLLAFINNLQTTLPLSLRPCHSLSCPDLTHSTARAPVFVKYSPLSLGSPDLSWSKSCSVVCPLTRGVSIVCKVDPGKCISNSVLS